MKKFILAFALITFGLAFTGCREKETKVIIQERPVEVKEDDKGILEKVGEEVDKEIDEEIDKIGKDD